MTTGAVDVVIVTRNTKTMTIECVASVFHHPPRALGDVFVIDNASTDGTIEAVRAAWPAVKTVALERNVGFGAANNVAIRQATAPLVLLLNSDALATDGAIDRLQERLAATGSVAAGPRLVDATGRPEISFGPMLSPLGELAQRARVRLASRSGRIARALTHRRLARERTVDWVSGACLLVRRDAAIAAGLFDERYFLYEEDVDFCAALRAHGGRVLFTPTVEVVHRRGGSGAPSGTANDLTRHYDRSHLAFYEKHAPHWAPWLRAWLGRRGRDVR